MLGHHENQLQGLCKEKRKEEGLSSCCGEVGENSYICPHQQLHVQWLLSYPGYHLNGPEHHTGAWVQLDCAAQAVVGRHRVLIYPSSQLDWELLLSTWL